MLPISQCSQIACWWVHINYVYVPFIWHNFYENVNKISIFLKEVIVLLSNYLHCWSLIEPNKWRKANRLSNLKETWSSCSKMLEQVAAGLFVIRNKHMLVRFFYYNAVVEKVGKRQIIRAINMIFRFQYRLGTELHLYESHV